MHAKRRTPSPAAGLGHRIRKLRELRDLTQEYLAEELGMSVSGYSRIERDEVRLSSDKLLKIAAILGVSAEMIISFNEDHLFQPPQRVEVHRMPVQGSLCRDVEHLERLYREQIELLKEEIKFLREQLRKP
jgi:transcriptional regulator with XRE-family HTH domain